MTKERRDGAAGDLSRLLSYYLACVEEEDRRSLELSADPKYGQFVTPPGEPGALFRGSAEIDWEPSPEDRKFLSKYALDLGQQRYLYGYPVFFDGDGHVAPLFFSEVESARVGSNGRIKLHLPHPGAIQVNLHLFRATHSMALERLELQDHLEGPDFGTIDARVEAAMARLGGSSKDLLPLSRGTSGWRSAAILFRDSGAMFTAQLRRELSGLKTRPPTISNTALGALLGGQARVQAPRRPFLKSHL